MPLRLTASMDAARYRYRGEGLPRQTRRGAWVALLLAFHAKRYSAKWQVDRLRGLMAPSSAAGRIIAIAASAPFSVDLVVTGTPVG